MAELPVADRPAPTLQSRWLAVVLRADLLGVVDEEDVGTDAASPHAGDAGCDGAGGEDESETDQYRSALSSSRARS
jgi:hypothetical protein